METRLIKTTLIFVMLHFFNAIFGQKVGILSIDKIMLDSISLKDARYISPYFGKSKSEKKWTEDYEGYSLNFSENTYDSLIVLSFTSNKDEFINWIRVIGQNHVVTINEISFQVNDNIIKIKNTYPKIYDDYTSYLLKNKDSNSILYFGLPVKIANNSHPDKFYNGSIKFGIYKNIVKVILIDLRTEGDFD